MKLIGRYQGYSRASFQKDLISGIIVGIVAIPLGMAFAIASGVKPEYGLFTVIVAGIAVSLFGGSKFQIGGPTGAFVPILLAIVLQYGYENLLIAGFLAGAILLLMGVFRLGALIQYIPRPVTIGFTAGIAVTIFTGQIANFLGLRNLEKHEAFLANMKELAVHLGTASGYSVLTAAICLVCILLVPKVLPRVPGSLAGLLISTVAASLFYPDRVATIGTTYGAIPHSLPGIQLPHLTLDSVSHMIKPALVIAMLGGIESLLSAVVADGMAGTRHNSNRELIGQGVANMLAPLFGGIPATGAIARTATNIRSGAASPLSGVIHSLVVLLILFLLAPYASSIPLASMAPILMVVAWNMSERKGFAHLLRNRNAESLVLVVTFALTVLTDLTTAVGAGLLLSAVIFVKRMSDRFRTVKVLPDFADKRGKVSAHIVHAQHDCPQISIFAIEGALFFGTANRFERDMTEAIEGAPKVLLLRMGNVPYMDATGEAHFGRVIWHLQQHGGIVLLSEVQPQPLQAISRSGLGRLIGQERIFGSTGDAIQFALTQLDHEQCLGCRHFAFRECRELSGA